MDFGSTTIQSFVENKVNI